LRDSVQALQDQQRTASEASEQTGRKLADLEARAQALAALQAKIGQSKDNGEWLEQKSLTRAKRLWQGLDIEAGWEDALEAVLRERLNAIELDRLDAVLDWLEGAATPPGRLAVYALAGVGPTVAANDPADSLLAKIRSARPQIARLLGDWLRGRALQGRCRRRRPVARRARGRRSVCDAARTPGQRSGYWLFRAG
jgi:chromosome segregation protein